MATRGLARRRARAPGLVPESGDAAGDLGPGDGGSIQGARSHGDGRGEPKLWKTMAAIWPPYEE